MKKLTNKEKYRAAWLISTFPAGSRIAYVCANELDKEDSIYLESIGYVVVNQKTSNGIQFSGMHINEAISAGIA